MPTSPPLSPTPRRVDHPDFAALLSSWDGSSEEQERGFPGWRTPRASPSRSEDRDRRDESEVESFLAAPVSPAQRSKSSSGAPEIRTTSPSPQRPGGGGGASPAPSFKSSEGRLSPLMPPPSRGMLFSDAPAPTYARLGLTRGLPASSLRDSSSDAPEPSHVLPQSTGQSTSTIDRAYEGVFSALDELANPVSLQVDYPSQSASRYSPSPSPAPPVPTSSRPSHLAEPRLAAVSERTEPLSAPPSSNGSPTPPGPARSAASENLLASSIATRFPLPPSPVKGPRSAGTPQSSPKKASDLIKMFESRTGSEPPPPQPQFSRPTPFTSPAQSRLEQAAQDTPPSSYRSPWASAMEDQTPRGVSPPAPTPPPKSTSPLASFRSLVASWKSRSGSPSRQVTDSSGRDSDAPRSLGRGDRAWNVSIRRRRRHEGEEVGLAEQGEDSNPNPSASSNHPFEDPRVSDRLATHLPSEPERTPSVRSLRAMGGSLSPKPMIGEPIRTGPLFYLNVHDYAMAPDFEWVQTDARLYSEGLQLVWRTREGSQAMVTLDMDFCEEVASTYSPLNPMAGGDLGAAAARRQGDLAENLYPFKLVYDDGTERLGCDSARERVRWVNAIWTVLERTRANPYRATSLRVNRSSVHSSSDADGSASTQHQLVHAGTPQSAGAALPSSPLPQYVTDDAVIPTTGGLSAPIVQRGSRRLAASGLERARSLRRVASEADLSESAGGEDLRAVERHSTANILDIPLTVDEARSRPGSRDFTFARGIQPPTLTSPPPTYSTPMTQQGTLYGSAGSLDSPSVTGRFHTPMGPSSMGGMTSSAYHTGIRPPSPPSTGAPSTSGKSAIYNTAPSQVSASAYETVRDIASPTSTVRVPGNTASLEAAHATAPQSAIGTVPGSSITPARGTVPALAITGVSPSTSDGTVRPYHPDAHTSTHGPPPSLLSTSQPYATATSRESGVTGRESMYTTASSGLGSEFHTPTTKTLSMASGSYDTAPPPAVSHDSRYGTPSQGSVELVPPTPVRYQLRDNPVPTYRSSSDAAFGSAEEKSSYDMVRPPITQTSASKASTYASPASRPSTLSQYSTAPPPPISRSISFSSDIQEQAETATHISEPDSDENLISDLERRSSDGSAVSRPLQRRSAIYPQTRTRSFDVPDTYYGTAFSSQLGDAPPRTVYTQFGTDVPITVYETARDSAYTTAPSWSTNATHATTALPASSYHTAQTSQTIPGGGGPPPPPPPGPPSVSTAQSVASSRSRRIPPPAIPPSPSFPSSVGGPSGTSSSSSSTATTTSATTSTHLSVDLRYDLSRMLNYLHGQDQARSGVQTRMNNQLDRIERKVGHIAETMPTVADLPPPLPSKLDEDSPPASPVSTTSSTSTARPVTPPPMIIPDAITQQLDDMRQLLGTVIGQNHDILEQAARRRSLEVEFPNQGPGFRRLEDLLRRALLKLGDSEFLEDYPPMKGHPPVYHGEPRTPTEAEYDREGSMYNGTGSVVTDEIGPKHLAPPNSYVSSYDERRKRPFSGVPESLLDGSIPEGEFDEEFAMQNLPPQDPPKEQVITRTPGPPRSLLHRKPPPAAAPTPTQPVPQPYVEPYQSSEEYVEEQPEPEPELPPVPDEEPAEPTRRYRDEAPQPHHDEQQYEQDPSIYDDEEYDRAPTRNLPPPQPVDLPTPVRTPPQQPYPPQFGGSMRPPYPAGGMPPPPPGMTEMPRPSLPRIAGVRDPISTTYFRRGFPPAGPMGMPPMGMFPGPMGIPGPGMGPFMPGLRPGLGGFGGPIGPNVAPSLRRPGFFPPGVPGTTGDYGLPAAARYGNNLGPGRTGVAPTATTPDTGLGNTTSESTTPSATTEELVTPTTGHTPIAPPHIASTDVPAHEVHTHFHDSPQVVTDAQHEPSMETDDSFRRALDNAQAMAAAQGEHANEMSRYLHGMSDQIVDGRNATEKELANILADIGKLRSELQPKRVHGHVLPDGTVQLSNGDIVDGIRGAPIPGLPPPPPPPPMATHFEGRVLPDGTVMAGDMIVEGIRGAPSAAPPIADEPTSPQQLRDMEQDRKLASLMDKVAELMQRTKPRSQDGLQAPDTPLEELSVKGITATPRGPNTDITREKTVIKEREVIREGPSGRHKERETEDELERDMVTNVPPAIPVAGGTPAGSLPGGAMSNVPPASVAPTRVNPRTGKPLSLPKPLSLSPHDPSPIQEQGGNGFSPQLIREEHEEVIHRPNGGPPVHTHTTSRTYVRPDGSRFTVLGDDPVDPVDLGDVGRAATLPAGAVLGDPGDQGGMGSRAPTALGEPGSHHSDHEVFAQGSAPGVPTQHSEHEELTAGPGIGAPSSRLGRPATGPAGSVGDPGGAGSGGGSQRPPAQVWDTNHPRPRPSKGTTVAADPTGPGSGGAPPPPTSVQNVPSEHPEDVVEGDMGDQGAPGDSGDPSGPGDQGDQVPAGGAVEALPPPAASSKNGRGVHWDPRMPHKHVAGPPPKTSVLGDMPDNDPKKGGSGGGGGGPGSGAPADPPLVHPTPAGSAGVADPALVHTTPAGSGAGGEGGEPIMSEADAPDPAGGAASLSGPAPPSKPESKPGSGILQKLNPTQSKESHQNSATGPPVVAGPGSWMGESAPLVPGGKDTRFSDTVGVGSAAGDPVEHIPIPSAPAGSAISGKSKMKSTPAPSGGFVEHDGGDQPAGPAEDAVATPPGATAPPSSISKLLRKGKDSAAEADPTGSGAGAGGGGMAVPPPLPAPSQLEEVYLPDGSVAYIKKKSPEQSAAEANLANQAKSAESAKLSKKDKNSIAALDPSEAQALDAAHGPAIHESEVGRGHCSVCCPHEPKTTAGEPVQPCTHQDGPGDGGAHKPPSSKGKKSVSPPAPAMSHLEDPMATAAAEAGPGEAVAVAETGPGSKGGSNKLKKGMSGGGSAMSPEEEKMEDVRKLAAKQKAAAEQAAAEAAEKEQREKQKADKAKLAEDRHKESAAALADLKKALDALANDQKTWRTSNDEKARAQDKRRADKATRDKKYQDALDKLVLDLEENKKKAAAEGKKPGTQAILDALKTFGDGQGAFLRKLVGEIVDQLANQHKVTREDMKKSAREQVGFNLSGYLDDFSKALSGEVRTMLKEVGDLREIRRALYYELAELLLMKGRQSHGDLMAVIPYPSAAPKAPPAGGKKEVAKPAAPAGGGGGGPPKGPGGVPYWSAFQPPSAPVIGGPARPLPVPGNQHTLAQMSMIPGAVPPPPPASTTRPLPQV